MKTRWARALLVAGVVAASVVFAPTVAAQKGVGGLPPAGTYHFSGASVSFSSFSNNASIFLNVGTNTNVSHPEDAPRTTTSETMVFLDLFDFGSSTFIFACLFLDHPSDFTINKGLTTATLATTLTPATRTCPGGSPLTTTIGLSGSWTGSGPITTTRDKSSYKCLSYGFEAGARNLSNLGTANLTLTLAGVSTAFSSSQVGLNSNDFRIEAGGVADPGCGLAGVGTGPMAAGEYHNFGLSANGFFGFPPGPTEQIGLDEVNQVSHPLGAPATTLKEFDLNVSLFGGAFNGFGCWTISPSDVTSTGLTSASVQTTVTATSPICTKNNFGFGINFPLTVNTVWTGTGPLVQVRDENTFKCLGYTQTTESSVQSKSATSTATVTMPDSLGNPTTLSLTGGQGSLTYIDQRIEAEGVEQPACQIRF